MALGVVAVLVAASTAPAKRLGAFYYTGSSWPPETGTPRLGARAFELRFDNGYVTGVVAAAKLDRFLSFGSTSNDSRRDSGIDYPRESRRS